MLSTEMNIRAAQDLQSFPEYADMPVRTLPADFNLDLSDMAGDRLLLVDLEIDSYWYGCVDGESLAERLVGMKLPKTVRFIDLFIPGISTEHWTTSSLATNLALSLYNNHDYPEITTSRISSVNKYNFTLLIPPDLSSSNRWEVYGVMRRDISEEDDCDLRNKTQLLYRHIETKKLGKLLFPRLSYPEETLVSYLQMPCHQFSPITADSPGIVTRSSLRRPHRFFTEQDEETKDRNVIPVTDNKRTKVT